MAEYLTLNGVVIPCKAGGGLLPSRYGETLRMYNGRLRSTEEPLWRTRVWQFTTGPLTGAEWAVIRPVLVSIGLVNAGGYAITRGLTTVPCLVIPGEIPNEPDGDTTARFVASFQLLERSAATSLIGGVESVLKLVNVASDLPAARLAYIGPTPPGGGNVTGGDAEPCACPPAQCPSVTTVIGTFYSNPLAGPQVLSGPGRLDAGGIGINPWGTWWRMRLGMKLSVTDSAGVVLSGPYAWTTTAVQFDGGAISLFTVSPLVAVALPDLGRLKFEVLSIMGMNCDRGEDGFRPTMTLPATITLPGSLVEA